MSGYPLQRNQQPYVDIDGIRYTWDPTTGAYRDPNGYRLGDAGRTNPTPNPTPEQGQPATDPAPLDPYQSWLSKPSGSRAYRYIGDDATKKFYEDNPAQAWQQFTSQEFGNRQTPQSEYAQSQYGRYYADYLRWSEGDTTGQRNWTDYQTNDLAGQIRNSFTMQSPTQKGYNLLYQPAGRNMGTG